MAKRNGAPKLLDEIHQRLVERGDSLDQVEEELIDPANDLTEDQRAGLWLYAWSLQSPARQRYEALGFLGQVQSAEQAD